MFANDRDGLDGEPAASAQIRAAELPPPSFPNLQKKIILHLY